MINKNSRKLDKEDAFVLFAAAVKFDQANENAGCPYDVTVARVGYREMFERCRLAAKIIARAHVEEGDEWDGVVWFELLEGIGEDSLGARLLHELDECEFDAEGVHTVTLSWLKKVGG